jgi:hypothetical protein
MVIAAMICFGALLVAWILAPDGRANPAPAAAEGDAIPVAV